MLNTLVQQGGYAERLDGKRPCLLRKYHGLFENPHLVNLVVVNFPVEADLLGDFNILRVETFEGGKVHFFKSGK